MITFTPVPDMDDWLQTVSLTLALMTLYPFCMFVAITDHGLVFCLLMWLEGSENCHERISALVL